MGYTIELDHPNKLVRYSHKGEISKENVGEAWEEFLKLNEFVKDGYNLMSDYREARFQISFDEVYAISDFLFHIRDILHKKKQALIISEPMNKPISVLFEGEINHRIGFVVKVFATEDKAMEWLLT
jgi:hypothetical protein